MSMLFLYIYIYELLEFDNKKDKLWSNSMKLFYYTFRCNIGHYTYIYIYIYIYKLLEFNHEEKEKNFDSMKTFERRHHNLKESNI